MLGLYFLMLFIGECSLFILVLGYAAIEESINERAKKRAALAQKAADRAFAVYQAAEEDATYEINDLIGKAA